MSGKESLTSDFIPVWTNCLEVLESALDSPVRNSLQNSRPLLVDGNQIKIGVQGSFSRDYLSKTQNREIVRAVLKKVTGEDLQVEFVALKGERADTRVLAEPRESHTETELSSDVPDLLLNPRYTFDAYIQGSGNNLAAAAARAVAESPAKAYNPLFIYGGVGLGKTHLMHAIAHAVLMKRRKARVVYMSAERFTNEMIDSISEAQMNKFRRNYRNVDVLLVDDIQFLANKERTQEEFFHTFNELHGAYKQIVISSDRPPKQIPTLEDRLRSRFEWGMIADIQPPDVETRSAILRKKAEQCGVPIPHDVTSLIAEKIPSNIRELEGALTRVIAYSSLQRQPVTLNLALEALQGLLSDSPVQVLDIKSIQEIVAEYFGISLGDLLGKRRDQRVVRPRQVAMYLCKEMIGASYPEIGAQFGGKDHTTVMHAFRKVEENLGDTFYKTSLDNITQRLKELSR